MLFVCRYHAANQKAPTGREILEHLAWKSTNATNIFSPLVKKGYLEKSPEKPRSVGRNLVITAAGVEWFNAQPKQPPLAIQERLKLT
jgi:DNA-binding MarR family transcriptional regulator